MPHKYFFCILVYFSLPINVIVAQNNTTDSLFTLYEQATEDSIKIDFLNQLVLINWDRDREKTIEYNKEILKLTEKSDLKEWRLEALQSLGAQYNNLRQHRLAIDYLHQAIAYRAEHKLTKTPLEKLYLGLGIAYNLLSKYKEATDYFQKSLALALAHKDSFRIAEVRRNLGDLFGANEKYEIALEYYLLAQFFYQSWDNPSQSFQLTVTNFRIGEVYRKMAAQEKNEALREANFQKAEAYFAEGLEIGKNYPEFKRIYCMYLSIMYEQKEMFPLSLDYAKKIKELFEGGEKDYSKVVANLRIASVLSKMGEYNSTILYADSALVYAENKAAFWRQSRELKKLKFEAYSNLGEYKKALALVPALEAVRDSLNRQELQKEVASMEANQELAKKKQEVAQQQLQLDNQELLLAKQTQQRNYLIFLSFLLLGLIAAIYYAYRQKSRHNRKLARLNQLVQLQKTELKSANNNLKDFSQTISHDILSQIELIISITGMNALTKISAEQQKAWAEVKGIGQKLKSFALGLITLAKIEAESSPLEEVDLNAVLADIRGTFRQQIDKAHAQIETKELPTILAHEAQMVQLFQNLITNAIRYKKEAEPPIIEIEVTKKENEYLFSVTDNGLGIPKGQHEVVFQSFKRISNTKTGSGLGLAICKKIVTYYEGKIWLESEEGKGTTVFFTYPL